MKTLLLALPIFALVLPVTAQPAEYSLEARENSILIDGVVDAEWGQHGQFTFGETEGLSWRGTYDNSYYYFLIEGDGAEVTAARIYLYGADTCDGFSEEPPFRVTWTPEHGARVYQAEAGSPVWEQIEAEGVFAAGQLDAGGGVIEIAVPGSLIGSSLGAGGDFNWTTPIRLMVAARSGSSYQFWLDTQDQDYYCDYKLIAFNGWPRDAIDFDAQELEFDRQGGSGTVEVQFTDANEPLSVETDDWIQATLDGRSLSVSVSANAGGNRVGYVILTGLNDTAFGSLKVNQLGMEGSPWDFDFRDPLTGDIYSWLDVIYIPGLPIEAAPPASGVIWSYDHGWMAYTGNDSSNVFLYHYGMGLWWWTSEENFPYIFIWDDNPNWFWYNYAGPQSGPRLFYDFERGAWVMDVVISGGLN